MDPADLEDGALLTEEDLAGDILIEGTDEIAEGTAIQQRVIVPEDGKRGAIQEDGTVRIAIMRPCISRGKRIRGLPPIYTPAMLAENASVFTGWPMYVGHLHPQLQAKILEVGRSPADLGGRVVKSWYDPDLIFEDDAEFGFRKGGVVGDVIPYKLAEEILSRDPHGLHASVNAWPRGAKVGRAPWDSTVRGMLVEGIRAKPVGSVDWVVRGGAGGRVDPRTLSEGEAAVITILESCYGSAGMEPDFSKMNAEQLTEWLRENRSDLVPVLVESLAGQTGGGNGGGSEPALTEEKVREILSENARSDEDIEKLAEQKAEELVQERETLRAHEKRALELIREADGLTDGWRADLIRKYTLLPSGANDLLIAEAEVENDVQTKGADEVLESRVKDDIQAAVDLIREAQGKPKVRDQGGGGGDPTNGNDGTKTLASDDPLVEFLAESGVDLGDEKDKRGEKALAAIMEEATY